jgi:hypothetical protein
VRFSVEHLPIFNPLRSAMASREVRQRAAARENVFCDGVMRRKGWQETHALRRERVQSGGWEVRSRPPRHPCILPPTVPRASNTMCLRGVPEAHGPADAAIYTMSASWTCVRHASAVDVYMSDFQASFSASHLHPTWRLLRCRSGCRRPQRSERYGTMPYRNSPMLKQRQPRYHALECTKDTH